VKQPRCLPEPRGGGDRPASAMSPMSAEGSQATLSSRPRSARGERSGGAVAARRERPASALPFTAAAPHAFEQPAEIHARQLYLNTCAPSSSSSCSAIRICPPTHDLAPEYKNAGPALGIPRWAANAAGPSSASLTRAACLAGAVGTRLRRAPWRLELSSPETVTPHIGQENVVSSDCNARGHRSRSGAVRGRAVCILQRTEASTHIVSQALETRWHGWQPRTLPRPRMLPWTSTISDISIERRLRSRESWTKSEAEENRARVMYRCRMLLNDRSYRNK